MSVAMHSSTGATLAPTDAMRADVSFIRCRKCGADVRCKAPLLSELRGRVDREVRCPSCSTLLAIWSSSTGGS